MDVDYFRDIKVRRLLKAEGAEAIAVHISLLGMIYKEGYYVHCSDDVLFLAGEDCGVDDERVKEIVERMVELELFDKALWQSEQVLTSKAIQRRYKDITGSIKRKSFIEKYNLVSSEETGVSSEETIVNTEKTGVNSEKTGVSSKFSTQSKVKESKRKKEIVVSKDTPISQKIKKNNTREENSKATKVLVLYNTAIKVANERYEKDETARSCRLMLARKLTEARIKPLCNIADNYNENEIKTAFWNATQSMFCNGRSKDRSRPVDIDWLLKPEVFVKALEGNL